MADEPASNCACGTLCSVPELPSSKAHKCPGCEKPIHALCGIETGDRNIAYSNRCFTCHDKLKPPPTTNLKDNTNCKQGESAAPPTNIKKKASSTKKKSGSKTLNVKPPTRVKDTFIGKQVAFDLDGDNRAIWLGPETMQYGESIGSMNYLFGTIVKKDTSTKTAPKYIVEWDNTNIKKTKLDTSTLLEGISKAITLASKENNIDENTPLDLNENIVNKLTAMDDTYEEGPHLESDAEDEEEEDIEGDKTTRKKSYAPLLEELDFESLQTPSADLNNGLTWKLNGSLPPPHQATTTAKAKLKPSAISKFTSPLKSFLAFLPVEFWKLYVHRCNSYARFKIQTDISKGKPAKKWTEITLDEFMTFWGILIKMTLRPMPGRRYIDCWDEPQWHPYTRWMSRSRFTDIRSVLHMSEKGPAEDMSRDTLYKVRPLLNTLKATINAYLIPGSDLALDEASVAARSKYGRHLIFYNNQKPCGKYSFRLYVVGDCDTYAALRLRVHTKDSSDFADGPPQATAVASVIDTSSNEEKDDEEPILVALVLDMFKPWFNSGRVANMDNYYTSPKAFLKLQENGILARGTCRVSRSLFPQSVVFSSSDAAKLPRGSSKVAVCKNKGLVAMGWVDGNPVHFLTTADGTNEASVERRVNSQKQTIKARKTVVNYNKKMLAVDCIDQLISLFSLAKRHQFKKYYNKLTIGLMDFGLANAEIHYFLANPEDKAATNHRYLFRDTLANSLFETDWTSTSSITDPIFDDIAGTQTALPRVNPSMVSPKKVSCSPVSVSQYIKKNKTESGASYEGMCCQVCLFEGRSRTSRHVVICMHGVRACTINHKGVPPKSEIAKKL